jgi:isoamylase
VKLDHPDWGDGSHSIAFTAELRESGVLVHLILNAYWEPLDFELPQTGGERPIPWKRWLDTGLPSPDDIAPWQQAPAVNGPRYLAEPRSVIVLFREIAPAT